MCQMSGSGAKLPHFHRDFFFQYSSRQHALHTLKYLLCLNSRSMRGVMYKPLWQLFVNQCCDQNGKRKKKPTPDIKIIKCLFQRKVICKKAMTIIVFFQFFVHKNCNWVTDLSRLLKSYYGCDSHSFLGL